MRRWLIPGLALLPVVVLVPLGLAMEWGFLPSTFFVVRLQTRTGALAILLGPVVTLAGLAARGLKVRWEAAVRRARAQERDAQAAFHRRFVRRLNHELKNPLTAIRAGLANLDDAPSTVPPSSESPSDSASAPVRQSLGSLGNVHRQVERLSQLVNDLRKLADLDAGEVERASVDLAEIVAEAVEMARSVSGRAEREVVVSIQKLPWQLSPVQGDRDLLLLALYNLIDNALKFSALDAAVEVRASEDGSRATVEVADTGRGIGPDDLPHIAEELYRGRGAEGVEGSGLGLALVEQVARLHGGELAIRSREGKGTVAALRLPLG